MTEESSKKSELREYLLGNTIAEEEKTKIEERLMLGEDYFQELLAEEEELVQDYVDGNLTPPEILKFEKKFLITEEGRSKIQFARALRKLISEQTPEVKPVNPVKKENSFFSSIKKLFLQPIPIAAAILLISVISIFFGWKYISPASNNSRFITSLNKAYSRERPIESRITDLNYAPSAPITRGNDVEKVDKNELKRAELLALDAVSENTSAESYHALGQVYLSEKKFDDAVKQFEAAVKIEPNNAKLHSNLGAAWLEKGKIDESNENSKSLEFRAKAIEEFEKAIKIDKNLAEAYFNKALCLQSMKISNQAIEAWQEYLKLDQTSQWADEARKNLEILESQKSQEFSTQEFEQAFLNFFDQKNEEQAWQLISGNRELIKKKYLPQKLAMSFLESSGADREGFLQALIYVGDLEKQHTGDSFAEEIAAFYKKSPEFNLQILRQAQNLVSDGYKLSINEEFSAALTEYNKAQVFFLQVGDIWEAYLCEYQIAFCFYNLNQKLKSIDLWESLAEKCRRKDYKWLLANTSFWIGGAQNSLGQISKSKIVYEKALSLARETNDSYLLQRIALDLARQSHFVGQDRKSLYYLQQVFEEASKNPNSSLRQKWRNYNKSLEIISNPETLSLAKIVSLEAIQTGIQLKDTSFVIYSQIDAGEIYTLSEEFDEARKWLIKSKQDAQNISEEAERNNLIGLASLKLGHAERKAGNFEKAIEYYDTALSLLKNNPLPLYETQKGKLSAQIALGNDNKTDSQISETVLLTEKYRKEIREEQWRNSFFNNEQTIYDIAVESQFKNRSYEQAYNYAEISNSRSLLDWLQRGAKVTDEKDNVEVVFNASSKPFNLTEIREKMPDSVQLLQYTVLENKTLIWLISKEKFIVVESKINSTQLQEKIKNYLELLAQQNVNEQKQAEILSKELYSLLINPILSELSPIKQICLIPNKSLFQLPFAALLSANGKPLLQDYTLFYAPSANVFLLCTENAKKKLLMTNENLLSVGNPAFDREKNIDLPNLTDAEGEARDIGKIYQKSKVLIGREATKNAFLNSLEKAEIIQFAGHYIIRENNPLASYLVLAKDGNNLVDMNLTNAELIKNKLPNTKLVVLSACQTGIEQIYNGEGLIGLSRTFLATGVPLVVGSHWKVNSTATAELMKKFHYYRHLQKLSTVNSLRQAQLDMFNSSNENYRSPYFWAAFATFGGYVEY